MSNDRLSDIELAKLCLSDTEPYIDRDILADCQQLSAAVLAKSPAAQGAVAQDFWWLIENRSGGGLLYATADAGDKRWTSDASDAARFKTEAAAYNCAVQMRLVFRECNGGYLGENISTQQHGFIYAHPAPAGEHPSREPVASVERNEDGALIFTPLRDFYVVNGMKLYAEKV